MCLTKTDIPIIQKMLDESATKSYKAIVAAIIEGFKSITPSAKKVEAFERKTIIEMHDMQKDIKNISEKIDEMNEHMNTFITSADHKYASKEIEKAIKKVMWIVMTAVIIALLALVIKS